MSLLNKLKNYWIGYANGSPARENNETLIQVSGRPPISTIGQPNVTITTCAKIVADAVSMANFAIYDSENKRINTKMDHILNIRSNQFMTAGAFWHIMTQNVLVHGNAYAYAEFKNGRLNQLIPLVPTMMRVLYDNVGLLGDVKMVYEYTDNRTNKTLTFLPGEIIHLKYNSRNGIVGIPTEEALAPVVDEDRASNDYLREVYRNGYSGVMALSYVGDLDSAGQKAVVKQVRNILDSQGNRMLALPVGIDAKIIGSGSIDNSYVNLRDRTTRRIAGYMGVPLILLDDNSGAGTAAMGTTQTASYYQHTIKPMINQIVEELSCKLLPLDQLESGIRIDERDISGFLLLDATARTENMVKLGAAGILTVNEIRHELGFDPYLDESGSGDKLYRNGAFMTADNGDSTGSKSEKIVPDNARKALGDD